LAKLPSSCGLSSSDRLAWAYHMLTAEFQRAKYRSHKTSWSQILKVLQNNFHHVYLSKKITKKPAKTQRNRETDSTTWMEKRQCHSTQESASFPMMGKIWPTILQSLHSQNTDGFL
jgi:hypothetical protein